MIARWSSAQTSSDDRGLTLVELLVAMALLTMVLAVIGGIFFSLYNTERRVTTVSTGATDAQLLATSIGDPIRNSSEFSEASVGTDGDEILTARVAGSAATLSWRCQAWYYDATAGVIRSTITNDGVLIGTPTPADLDGWSLIASGVSPRDGQPVFSEAGGRLNVAFEVAAGASPPIVIEFAAVGLTATEESASCY